MNKAVMLVNATPGYPFQGASAALNTYLLEALRRHYSVRVVSVQSSYVPLNALDMLERIKDAGPADLAVYCDLSHWIDLVHVVAAKRTIVFFHGLVGTPLVWMTRRFDALCCNSQWTTDVLRSLAGYPLWHCARVLCPDIFDRSYRVRCPLPALGHPNGAISGDPLPDEFYGRLARDSSAAVLGSFWEADDQMHGQLIVAINAVAQEHGDRRRFRLLVLPGKLEQLERWLRSGGRQPELLCSRLQSLQLSLADVITTLPTVRVKQADLFRLMRICRFALMFNKVPESFGLMPLECVLNDCAVHTNGSGNIRHLLPPSHGILVHDVPPREPSADWALSVARAIYTHSMSESAEGLSEGRAELTRGRAYIHSTYTSDAFDEDIERIVHQCGRSRTVAAAELRLARGPLVRRWDAGDTDILCDTGIVKLTTRQEARVRHLLGASAATLFAAAPDDQALVSGMWRKGLLTWTTGL